MDTEALTQKDITLLGLAQKSGLSVLTCEDLLNKGWVYVEELNKPSRWVNPLLRLRVR